MRIDVGGAGAGDLMADVSYDMIGQQLCQMAESQRTANEGMEAIKALLETIVTQNMRVIELLTESNEKSRELCEKGEEMRAEGETIRTRIEDTRSAIESTRDSVQESTRERIADRP